MIQEMDVASADFTNNTNIVQLSEPQLNPRTKMKENVSYRKMSKY